MKTELLSEVDPRIFKYQSIKYDKQMGPEKVPDLETARRVGANCATFAHLYNEEIHGWRLPSYLGPLEMWFEEKFLRPASFDKLMIGDIAFFGRRNIDPRPVPENIKDDPKASARFMREHQVPHVACVAGGFQESGEVFFAHLSYAERGFAVWPESRFYDYRSSFGVPLYERLYVVKRPLENYRLKAA